MEHWIRKINDYKERLSLNDVNINVIISSSSTSIRFDREQEVYFFNFNELGKDYDIIHELGHIFLTKKTRCLIFSSPPIKEGIDDKILAILDYLINNFVNFRVSRIDNFYPLYRDFFINAVQLNYRFSSVLEELASNIWMHIESLFILKPIDRNLELIKYMALHNQSLKKKTSFSLEKYEELLPNLFEFNQVKYSNEKEVIINYLRTITHLICEVCDYQNRGSINTQLDLIFSNI